MPTTDISGESGDSSATALSSRIAQTRRSILAAAGGAAGGLAGCLGEEAETADAGGPTPATPGQASDTQTPATDAGTGPTLLHVSRTIEPGDVIGAYGAGLGTMERHGSTETKLLVQPLSEVNQRGDLDPDGESTRTLTPFNVNRRVAHAELPDDLSPDAYAVWVRTPEGTSDPVFPNRAEAWWSSVRVAYPGQEIRLFGRNFLAPGSDDGSSTAVRVIDAESGDAVEATVEAATEYTADITLPEDLSDGEYTFAVSNGVGGSVGQTRLDDTATLASKRTIDVQTIAEETRDLIEEVGVDAAWLDTIPADQRFDVTEHGATGDGNVDDTDGIQAALDAAKEAGGGVVEVPEGTYPIRGIEVPGNTVLLGEGPDTSELVYDGGEIRKLNIRSFGLNELVHVDGEHVGLSGLRVANPKMGLSREEMLERSEEYFGASSWLDMVSFNDRGQIEGGGRGKFVVNCQIENENGMGVNFFGESEFVVEDSTIHVTHTPYGFLHKMGHMRVRNCDLQNKTTNGSYVWGSAGKADSPTWIEGNTFTGIPTDGLRDEDGNVIEPNKWSGAMRVQVANPYNYYIADNTTKGRFGTPNLPEDKYNPHTFRDGEGILWEDGYQFTAAGTATGGGERTLTDANKDDYQTGTGMADYHDGDEEAAEWKADALVGRWVSIVDGRGVGQVRRIVGNDGDTLEIEEPWTIQPDETSVYYLRNGVQMNNIVVDNAFHAEQTWSALEFYVANKENIVADNSFRDNSGIIFQATKGAHRGRMDFSYFNVARNNDLRGGAINKPGFRYPNALSIGPWMGWRSGGDESEDPAIAGGLGMYGNEYRRNTLEARGSDVEELCSQLEFSSPHYDIQAPEDNTIEEEMMARCKRYARQSGLGVTGSKANRTRPWTQGTVVQDNTVRNAFTGFRAGNSASDIALSGNTFENVGIEYDGANIARWYKHMGDRPADDEPDHNSLRTLELTSGGPLPGPTSEVTVESAGDGAFSLSWSPALYADHYRVERAPVGADEDAFEVVAESVSETTYTDETSDPTRYRVVPVNDRGDGLPARGRTP